MSLSQKLAEHGIKLSSHRLGGHKTVCPACSHTRKDKKDPCLSVTVDGPESFVSNCHHCGFTASAGGPSRERRVYRRPDYRVPLPEQWGLPPFVIQFFERRGIGPKTLKDNHIGHGRVWMPKADAEVDAILFPFTRRGEVVNIKYRAKSKDFRQEKDAEKVFYGLDHVTGPEAIIVEGEMDKLALWEAGVPNVLSVPDGAPNEVKAEVSADDAKFEYLRNCETELAPLTKIVLAVDADRNGKNLEEELARRLGRERCWRVTWPDGCKDANDVLLAHGPDALARTIRDAQPYPVKGIYRASDFQDEILAYYDHGGSRGASTGWRNVDELYTVRPGELCVVTASPGSGKSEWIDAVMMNLATAHGWRFGLCSFENPKAVHAHKLASKFYRMPYRPGPAPHITRAEMERFTAPGGWLSRHFVWMAAEDDATTFDWILEKARAMVLRDGIKGLVIDPYNEIEHQRDKNQTETEYVSSILSKAKRFAQNHGVHVWFVAHPAKLKREADGAIPVPSLYDISGSANWVNKADVGLVIHRDMKSEYVDLHFKKIRFKDTGKVGEATLRYDYLTGTYSEA